MVEQWERSLQLLLDGDYDNGFPKHEWVCSGNPSLKGAYGPTATFGHPIWEGESEPITLLVNADFGMGDTIQFLRFVPQARDRVARLVLRCDEDFKPLFRGTEVLGKEEPLPQFDKIIHMMALPHALSIRKADILGRPYLEPNPDRPMDYFLQSTMKASRFTKIGVCWSGNPFNSMDGLRSLPRTYQDTWPWSFGHGTKFFSLDKINPPPNDSYFDMRAHMGDWNATAHLIKLLDLVISVDTAVAHLSASMGVPTWVIVRGEEPEWRWGREGDRTLWYDSVRLFRREGSWDEVLTSVASSLQE